MEKNKSIKVGDKLYFVEEINNKSEVKIIELKIFEIEKISNKKINLRVEPVNIDNTCAKFKIKINTNEDNINEVFDTVILSEDYGEMPFYREVSFSKEAVINHYEKTLKILLKEKNNEIKKLKKEINQINTLLTAIPLPYVEIAGIKWAKCNIGAEKETDIGLYFQWGDTKGYTAEQVGNGKGQKYFGWKDYKYGNGTNYPVNTCMAKYNYTDGKVILEAEDDAATANWGNDWRMPTRNEYAALRKAVNAVWTENYKGSGVAGLVCTDKTDSSKVLFFPACGYCCNGTVHCVGGDGSYWSSSHISYDVQYSYYLNFYIGGVYCNSYSTRRCGFPIRGVMK